MTDSAQVSRISGTGSNGNARLSVPQHTHCLHPNQETDFSWTVRNDSGCDMTSNISSLMSRTNMRKAGCAPRDLPYDVYPGNPLSFTVDAVVPSAPGSYTMTYGVVQNFEIICNMDVTVYVNY